MELGARADDPQPCDGAVRGDDAHVQRNLSATSTGGPVGDQRSHQASDSREQHGCSTGSQGVDISLEEMEEYHMVISKTFVSEEDGFRYYNEYARVKGFSVRKDDIKRDIESGMLVERRFVCFREGERIQKYFERTDQRREPRTLTRCGCPALLHIKLDEHTVVWYVKNFIDEHNHPLARSDLVPWLRSHRQMTSGQQADAVEYALGGLRTYQIMEVMEKHYGGYDKAGFVKRDLYNFFARYKTKQIRSKDAQFLLNHMKAQQAVDPDFFFRLSVDSKGRLKNIFWADSQSRLDYEAFGDMVIFDSTYRVNRYSLPFVPFIGVNHHRSTVVFGCGILSSETVLSYEWLLTVFLEAARHKHPKSLITDGDSAMRNAIQKIMPLSDHWLCSCHIEQNMIRNLRNPVLGEFREFIYHPMGIEEFESRWHQFKQTYEISDDNQWFNMMYELRMKWSAAYTKGMHFLGMVSNQRSESLNSRLHRHLDRKMSLVDLLEHYEHCMSRIRRNEAELDAKASQSIPFTKTAAEPLEKSAAVVYTPVMFKRVRKQIRGMSAWEIELHGEEDFSFTFIATLKDNAQKYFHVSCMLDDGVVDGVSCECRKMECEDIPCTHIFALLKYLGVQSIPQCCINSRWTMEAKVAYISDRNTCTHVWSEQMARYRQLRNKGAEALFLASQDSDKCQRAMDFLQSILDEMTDNDANNIDETTFGPLPAHFSAANPSSAEDILDPEPIIPER